MKKQIKKLSLNKKTISNLTVAEMSKHVGGSVGYGTCYHCGGGGGNPQKTKNGNTCNGHVTCNSCVNTCVNYTC